MKTLMVCKKVVLSHAEASMIQQIASAFSEINYVEIDYLVIENDLDNTVVQKIESELLNNYELLIFYNIEIEATVMDYIHSLKDKISVTIVTRQGE